MNKNVIAVLNISRWVAAFLVVLSHVKTLILVDFNYVNHPTFLIKILYLISGVGHEAVVVFFVISGFLVGGITFKKWTSKGPAIVEYAIHRFSRIYTVLVPALLVGGLIDYIGLNWFNYSKIYTATTSFSIASMFRVISDQLSLKVLLQNLAMLEEVCAPILGSNGPLWSLAYEWWYYILFAIFCLAYVSKGLKRYALVLTFIVIGFLLPTKLMLMMSIWWLGFVLYIAYDKFNFPQKPILFTGLFFLSMALCRISRTKETGFEFISVLKDLGLGITYCMLLLSLNKKEFNWKPSKIHQHLAEFSYSLYLTHFPIMVLIVAFNYQVFNVNLKLQPTFLSATYVFSTIFIIYIYSFIFSRATDSNTAAVKNILQKKLDLIQKNYVGNS